MTVQELYDKYTGKDVKWAVLTSPEQEIIIQSYREYNELTNNILVKHPNSFVEDWLQESVPFSITKCDEYPRQLIIVPEFSGGGVTKEQRDKVEFGLMPFILPLGTFLRFL